MKIASVLLSITAPVIKQLAHACGFELAGVTLAEPVIWSSPRLTIRTAKTWRTKSGTATQHVTS